MAAVKSLGEPVSATISLLATYKFAATDFEALTFHAQDISSDKLDGKIWAH